MKKSKVLLAFTALMFLMSSCVYSLFPIYTEDTLVFLPELVGKWQLSVNEPNSYIEFVQVNSKDEENIKTNRRESRIEMNDDSDGDKETYSYFMQGDGWSIKSDDPITVEVDGKEVSDPKEVKAYYDKMFGEMRVDAKDKLDGLLNGEMAEIMDSTNRKGAGNLSQAMSDLGKGLGALGEAIKKTEAKFKGTAYVSTDESYRMTVMDNGEIQAYQVHVVEIGGDYFMDMYPLPEFTDNTFSENLFPVHTFMKLSIEGDQLKLIPFDLEKLNELFESNLVRLRHEYVDGNVVITAQPKEIQKFLEKYSNDEKVFDESEVYYRMIQ